MPHIPLISIVIGIPAGVVLGLLVSRFVPGGTLWTLYHR